MIALLGIAAAVGAQPINWANIKKEDKHFVHVKTGIFNGVQFGAGYSYKVNQRLFPVMLNADYSVMSGDKILQDFKARLGGNIRWMESHGFAFSTSLHAIFRRYGNDYVRLANFGTEVSGVAGYYRRHWFVAAETGFDKAIVTHFRHSQAYKSQYPGVQNGWYETSTGGNFYYGLQAGVSLGKCSIGIRAGKILEQDFETSPLVPMYAEAGCTWKF